MKADVSGKNWIRYGLTNHVISDLPKKIKDYFEKGIKIDINFQSTGFDLEFGGF